MNSSIRPALLALTLASIGASAQVASFDATTNLATIPSVSVGASTFSNVGLRHLGNYVFSLESATPQIPPGPGFGSYDPSTSVLTLPAIKVGSTTYLGVQLQNRGNFVFDLVRAGAVPAATTQALNDFAASWDALWATAVPASGSARMSLSDSCFRSDGRTRAWSIADADSKADEYRQRDTYSIGRKTTNVQVLAIRDRVNPDGSNRQEIDIQWDIEYKDGTKVLASKNTLISGSSAGTPDCATPQTGNALRFLGNQRLVSASITARNYRDERYSIGTGAALSPAVNYRRVVYWAINDPMANATYVVVTGPGPAATVGGVATQFSLKFISPRLLASAAEFQGKTGNFLNWRDEDNWRYCRVSGSGTPVAGVADCTGLGASSSEFGVTTSTPNAAADQTFEAQGWVAGGVYRFDVYNDDGWKTVNGHAGKVPVATYYETLDSLPYSFVEMAGTAGVDKYPRLKFGSMTTAQVRSNAVSAAPSAMSVTWNAPLAMSDQSTFALFDGWEFHQGAKLGNTGGAFYPAYRTINFNYPGSLATANAAWNVTPKLVDQSSKTYTEFTLMYTDRNGRLILGMASFQ